MRVMSALRESGRAKLNLSPAGGSTQRDELLEAVRAVAGSEFTVLGEIGRAADGTIAYLARDRASRQLVALRLARSGGAGNEFLLEVAERLGTAIPRPPSRCPYCLAPVRGWTRFCTQCRSKLWSDRSIDEPWTQEDLLTAVREATNGRYEILGGMVPADGEGIIYFAREIATGRIEALRLQRDGPKNYSIGVAGAMKPFAERIAGYKRRSS